MAKKKPQPERIEGGPTRKEILGVIQSFSQYHMSNGRITQLEKEHLAAIKTVDDFEEKDKKYKKLRDRRDSLYVQINNERKRLSDKRRSLVNLIYLKGPTPEVVKEVEKFVMELNGE